MLSLCLHDICEFTKATTSSRNMIEGQRVINSGMIIMCGASSKNSESIELYALCLQTSALTYDPHEISGILNISKSEINNNTDEELAVSIEKMTCSCKAGSSQSCKHIVAVLLYCNRQDLNALQMVSSTDKKCLWKKHKAPVLEQFEAHPLKTFCCVNQQRLPTLSDQTQENIRCRLIDCYAETALAKHKNRRINSNTSTSSASRVPFMELTNVNRSVPESNQPDNGQCITKDYLDLIMKNIVCAEEMTCLKKISFDLSECCQKTYSSKIICSNALQTANSTRNCKSEWQKERKFRVTGSRCYSLYTYNQDNWVEKASKYFWAKEFSNKYTRHGCQYESIARNKYIEECNLFVQECGLVVSTSEPWMAYSPDGIVFKDNQVYKLLEIKCPYEIENTTNEVLLKKCKFLVVENNVLSLRKRHAYYGQIQFGMALLNIKECDFVVYSNLSDSIKILNVSYDKNFAEDLLVNLKNKYFKKMLHVICETSRVA